MCIRDRSNKIRSIINDGDRCIILSENRPNWLISDLSIMNAGGISVPIFTTYSPNDYKYILNDCKPSIIVVSNNNQFEKIKHCIGKEVKKIISVEYFDVQSLVIQLRAQGINVTEKQLRRLGNQANKTGMSLKGMVAAAGGIYTIGRAFTHVIN